MNTDLQQEALMQRLQNRFKREQLKLRLAHLSMESRILRKQIFESIEEEILPGHIPVGEWLTTNGVVLSWSLRKKLMLRLDIEASSGKISQGLINSREYRARAKLTYLPEDIAATYAAMKKPQ